MREARSSPSATNFRTVDRAHWSFALTRATESSWRTGMFVSSVLIFQASTTVRTLPVGYVVGVAGFLVIDEQDAQKQFDRYRGTSVWKDAEAWPRCLLEPDNEF